MGEEKIIGSDWHLYIIRCFRGVWEYNSDVFLLLFYLCLDDSNKIQVATNHQSKRGSKQHYIPFRNDLYLFFSVELYAMIH